VDGELPILERRTIEAGVIGPIYAELVVEVGEERARAVLTRAIEKAAIAAGASFAARTEGGTNLETFQALYALWTHDGALEIEVLEASPTRFDFNVTRCRYAETYRELGLGEIGGILSCNRDGVFCQGYDPRIRLQRTQTLMAGAASCDFRYELVEDG
jgi:hypothetical protein